MRINTRVVVSNYWDKPQIRVSLFHDPATAPGGGIALSLSLDDFLSALSAESGVGIDALKAATDSALEKIKQASTPVGVASVGAAE